MDQVKDHRSAGYRQKDRFIVFFTNIPDDDGIGSKPDKRQNAQTKQGCDRPGIKQVCTGDVQLITEQDGGKNRENTGANVQSEDQEFGRIACPLHAFH